MRIDGSIGLRGEVVCELVDERTGLVVVTQRRNIITTVGLGVMADLLVGNAPAAPSHIAIGTGAETQYAETNQDATADLTSSGGDQQLAQGFKLTNQRRINSALLYLQRLGTSPGSVFVELQGDSGGDPDGTPIATSQSISINGLETSYQWESFTFASQPQLSATTQYHLVLKSTGFTYEDGVTEVDLGVDQSAPAYADGELRSFDGASWSAFSPASDAAFRIIAAPESSYTTIVDETARNQLTAVSKPTNVQARLLANFPAGDSTGRHGMLGLLNDPTTGILIAAANIDLEKTSQLALNAYWIITVS